MWNVKWLNAECREHGSIVLPSGELSIIVGGILWPSGGIVWPLEELSVIVRPIGE